MMQTKEIKNHLRTIFRFLGPGFLVTVGFIDPGNWATNIEGGARFGYELLWVITLSTIMLIVIQNMSAKLGIATGKSLAVNIREFFPKPVSLVIGITVILACVATDVAELLGGAIGFHLLFGFPVWLGALITILLEIFFIISQRYHKLEKIIIGFLGIIAICYFIELFIVKPEWTAVLPALAVPVINIKSIYIAMGILGAVVMPHNIFLHSNTIQSRNWGDTIKDKKKSLKYEKFDTLVSMLMGWAINSSMIIVAAAVFFRHSVVVDSIEQASLTLKPLAGLLAGFLFSLALIFAGVGSSITSSMAEVNVIAGFSGKPENPKTLLYRISVFITAIPSFLIILFSVNTYKILIFSQVVLSIQLPFTLIPLIILVKNKKLMKSFASNKIEFFSASVIAFIVIALNIYLLYSVFSSQG